MKNKALKIISNDIMPKLVYGIFIPKHENKRLAEEWQEIAEHYRNYTLSAWTQKKEFFAFYEEIELFPEYEETDFYFHEYLPFAMLIETQINFRNGSQPLFLRLANMEPWLNIFYQEFVFYVMEEEVRYTGDRENWKQFIDSEKLKNIIKKFMREVNPNGNTKPGKTKRTKKKKD